MRKRIGRNLGTGPLVRSFDLGREDDGRVTIANPDDMHGPTAVERDRIIAHMSSPVRVLGGSGRGPNGEFVDGLVDMPPGTEEHFVHAVHLLPNPFGPMP